MAAGPFSWKETSKRRYAQMASGYWHLNDSTSTGSQKQYKNVSKAVQNALAKETLGCSGTGDTEEL